MNLIVGYKYFMKLISLNTIPRIFRGVVEKINLIGLYQAALPLNVCYMDSATEQKHLQFRSVDVTNAFDVCHSNTLCFAIS